MDVRKGLVNMEKMKFAIIGYGGMGAYHENTLVPLDSDLMEVTGSYDIREERQIAAKEAGLHVYENLNELLEDEAIEAVIIATPNDSHKDLAIQAMRAGKHVVCEKPVTMDTEEFDDILEVAKETDKVFMVHQNRRWDPDFLLVRDLFNERTLGDIFHIESRVHGANGIPGDWRHLKAQGGGMLLDWGVHLLDQMLWLVDSPVVDVKVDMSYILGNDVDDGFVTYITFENGIRVHVEVGTTNYVQLPRWYVKGNKGTAVIKDWDLSGKMIVPTGENTDQKPSPIRAGAGLTKTMAPPVDGVVEEVALPVPKLEGSSFYQNFFSVVRENAEPIVKNEEVREVMLLIDNIFDQVSKDEE